MQRTPYKIWMGGLYAAAELEWKWRSQTAGIGEDDLVSVFVVGMPYTPGKRAERREDSPQFLTSQLCTTSS